MTIQHFLSHIRTLNTWFSTHHKELTTIFLLIYTGLYTETPQRTVLSTNMCVFCILAVVVAVPLPDICKNRLTLFIRGRHLKSLRKHKHIFTHCFYIIHSLIYAKQMIMKTKTNTLFLDKNLKSPRSAK